MATHSSALAWKIPWMEEPGGLQFMGSQRVRHDWVTHFTTFQCLMEERLRWRYRRLLSSGHTRRMEKHPRASSQLFLPAKPRTQECLIRFKRNTGDCPRGQEAVRESFSVSSFHQGGPCPLPGDDAIFGVQVQGPLAPFLLPTRLPSGLGQCFTFSFKVVCTTPAGLPESFCTEVPDWWCKHRSRVSWGIMKSKNLSDASQICRWEVTSAHSRLFLLLAQRMKRGHFFVFKSGLFFF